MSADCFLLNDAVTAAGGCLTPVPFWGIVH